MFQLRGEFLAAVRSAVAIREEYRETGVVIEAETLGFPGTVFVLMPVGLENPDCALIQLSFSELEVLDGMSEELFHDTVREWTLRYVHERCDCPKCRLRRGEKLPADEQIERQFSRYRRIAR
jgi:hypothetical protein